MATLDPALALQLHEAPAGGSYSCVCASGFSGDECELLGLAGLAARPWAHAVTGAVAMIPIAKVERTHAAYPVAVFGAVMGCWLGLLPAAALVLLPRSRVVEPAVSAASGVLGSVFEGVVGVLFDLGAAIIYLCGALALVLAVKVGLEGKKPGSGKDTQTRLRNQAQELVAAASELAGRRRKAWVQASQQERATAKQFSPPTTRPVRYSRSVTKHQRSQRDDSDPSTAQVALEFKETLRDSRQENDSSRSPSKMSSAGMDAEPQPLTSPRPPQPQSPAAAPIGMAFGSLRERSVVRQQQQQQSWQQAWGANPVSPGDTHRFSAESGWSSTPADQSPAQSPVDDLRKLSQMRESGLLSPAEFRKAKTSVLGKWM